MIFIIGLSLSCTPEMDKEALKYELDKAIFDNSIITDSSKYVQLSNEIIKNLDTIFRFRDKSSFVTGTDENGRAYKKHSPNYSYDFHYNWDTSGNSKLMENVDLKNMPNHLITKIEKVIKELGKEKLNGFTIYKDSRIIFYLKRSTNGDFTTIHHLVWDAKTKSSLRNDFYSKEKAINPNLTYRIYTDQYMGW